MEATTFVLSQTLLPELTAELRKTRTFLQRVPEGHSDFRPHEKSKTLLELANHLATVSGLAGSIISSPGADLGGNNDPREIVKETTPAAVVEHFDRLAEKDLAQLSGWSDSAFNQTWEVKQQGRTIFSGTRYNAFRNIGLNHMIHHRAQLGVYLRLLDLPVPYSFGPTADENSPA